MLFGLKLFVWAVCLWLGIQAIGIAIAWLKRLLTAIKPKNNKRYPWE